VHAQRGGGLAEHRRVVRDLEPVRRRPLREALSHPIAGHGRLAIRHHGHASSVARVTPDGLLDAPDLGVHHAAHEGQVGLADAAGLELRL